jgi:4-amino-4-deoxychorismate lyase
MYRLLETIRLQEGSFVNLAYHQDRVDRSVRALMGPQVHISLRETLSLQDFPAQGVHKCRVVYDQTIRHVEIKPYEIRPVHSLRCVFHNTLAYDYKYEDRTAINELFQLRQGCDDVLIIRNGSVTDASYSNVVFYDGHEWLTPETPLLKGVMRQYLLDQGIIKAATITMHDIRNFSKVKLINAMLGFDGPEIDVSRIVF